MSDWKREIREHLASVDLPTDTREDVVAELASHLEECENEGSQNTAQTLGLSGRKGRELARAIYRAKRGGNAMNRRKSLWIPMFLNLLLTSALVDVWDWLGKIDLRIYRTDHIPLTPQLWIVVLPFCGATAAFLARRAEGSPSTRLVAALTPCFVWLTVPFVLELIFFCFPETFVGIPLRSLALSSVGLFVFPALALLLGAVPFLRTPSTKPQCELEALCRIGNNLFASGAVEPAERG